MMHPAIGAIQQVQGLRGLRSAATFLLSWMFLLVMMILNATSRLLMSRLWVCMAED